MSDVTAWKRPRQLHEDILDDFRNVLGAALRDVLNPGSAPRTERGEGYVRGVYDGVVRVIRLTLSEDELNALADEVRRQLGVQP
jgi:hypothetical protein